MKKLKKLWFLFAFGLFLAGCGAGKMQTDELQSAVEEAAQDDIDSAEKEAQDGTGSAEGEAQGITDPEGKEEQGGAGSAEDEAQGITDPAGKKGQNGTGSAEGAAKAPDVAYIDVPLYDGKAYTEINGNVPFFTDDELSDVSYEYYEELDALGRCGVCMASVGQDIMPNRERESIGDVKPTGWHTVKYEGLVDGNYLYNRCHLLGFQLTGENANRKNLITGTRYMNTEGMLPFENMVADYVKETGNHVMYRVTPLFDGDNLVADGVLMEAKSVEDNGADILFNVFCYNVQPGVSIDYATGESSLDESAAAASAASGQPAGRASAGGSQSQRAEQQAGKQPQTPDQSKQQAAGKQPQTPVQPEQQAPAQPEQQPEHVKEQTQPEQPASVGSGSYAVNAKNGKIHIVGGCPATGTSDRAMSEPVYFNTYEEAEAYSISIAPNENKRQCGNCW